MTKESQETSKRPTKFRIGPLKTLHQVLKANGKTIRVMAKTMELPNAPLLDAAHVAG